MRRLGFDPATSSAPFVATLVDVTGLLIYILGRDGGPEGHVALSRGSSLDIRLAVLGWSPGERCGRFPGFPTAESGGVPGRRSLDFSQLSLGTPNRRSRASRSAVGNVLPFMLPRRYTIVIADRSSGVIRRITLSLRPTLAALALAASLPVLIGLGARWSAKAEIEHLRASNATLREENVSFRAATGELTTQIVSLQSAIVDLGAQAQLDPATRTAVSKLPALVRGQAMGGARDSQTRALLAAAVRSPDDTFGVLKDLLGNLERRLNIVRVDLTRYSELANATPSIWPAMGWLTSGFGRRIDPFTGSPAQHLGLDIAADRGKPVFATANGVVQHAEWSGDYGRMVVIAHESGLTTRYAHLSRMAVSPGTVVKRGDVVGFIGATGRSTSPHLHYEVWANGRPLNPLHLLVGKPAQ
jgi:murein DD-endopeptidase MepM/ murein hydrolase activator NlpD